MAKKSSAADGPKRTDKQTAFVLEYLKDFNATQAAIRAGYSEISARKLGCELLTKPDIREAIDQHLFDIGLNAHKILAEQIGIAFSDINNYIEVLDGGQIVARPLDQIPDTQRRAIKKLKEKQRTLEPTEGDGKSVILDKSLELEFWDKHKALDALMNYLSKGSGDDNTTAPGTVHRTQYEVSYPHTATTGDTESTTDT